MIRNVLASGCSNLLVASASLVITAALTAPLDGQAISDLPRPEYYVAKAMLGSGRVLDASGGFETAFNRGRRVGDLRWVDSVPPLVMMGECHFQLGQLNAALAKYEQALQLLQQNPGWIDRLDLPIEQLPELDSIASGINWFPKSEPLRPLAIPQSIQLAIDPTQLEVDPRGNVRAPVSLLTRLDATEVFRTSALAIYRRQQILGPLTEHTQLTKSLGQMLTQAPRQPVPWVHAAWNALRGIHGLHASAPGDSLEALRGGLRVEGRFDYFLTPLVSVVLARQAIEDDNYQRSMVYLQDASLVAAVYEQAAVLAEATELLGSVSAATHRRELSEAFRRLADWSAKRSRWVRAEAVNAAAELEIVSGDATLAERLIQQLSPMLRSGELALPRLQARATYTSALLGFRTGRDGPAQNDLQEALASNRGTSDHGPIAEAVFQAQMTLDSLASGSITQRAAESMLETLLAEPSSAAWHIEPLKTMARITTASEPAYERLLQLGMPANDPQVLLQRLDRLQRQRLFEALPLGGRLLAWRAAASAPPNQLTPETRQIVAAVKRTQPQIDTLAAQLRTLVDQLQAGPLPLDERQLSSEHKQRFQQVQSTSDNLESQLTLASIGRNHLPREMPAAPTIDQLRAQLQAGDAVLAFAATSRMLVGVAISADKLHVWQVSNVQGLREAIKDLHQKIGIADRLPSHLPEELASDVAPWRDSARALSELLLPRESREIVESSRRLIIAPHDQLWYVPFGLLPASDRADAEPMIAVRSVSYIPTLGSLSHAYSPAAKPDTTVGVLGKFFAAARDSNKALGEELNASIANSSLIQLDQRLTVADPTWLRLTSDQLWIAQQLDTRSSSWESSVLPGSQRGARLSSWLESPRRNPQRVIMPGTTSRIRESQLGSGNEIFLPACSLMLSGTRSAVLSRWPVGGVSTQRLLKRYLDELQLASPSEAWQRSVLAMWSEEYTLEFEPVLQPSSQRAAPLVSGFHPLLWSGYIMLGDEVP